MLMLLVCGPECSKKPPLFSIDSNSLCFFFGIISLPGPLFRSHGWSARPGAALAINPARGLSPLASRLSFLIVLIIQGHP